MSTTTNIATPDAIAAGLLHPELHNGEPCFTDAGMFALAGMMAYGTEFEGGEADDDSRLLCARGVTRALRIARTGGMSEQMESAVLWAFAKGISPADSSEEGKALASLCRLVARLVGAGRMGHVISGEQDH